jgi:hypothetical protein
LPSGGVLAQSLRNGELEWPPGFPDLDKTQFQWFKHCYIRLLSVRMAGERIPLQVACYAFCAWWTCAGLAASVHIGTFDVTVNKRHGMPRHVHWKSTDILEANTGLATCFMIVSFLAYSSTLKMEAACFSETSVDLDGLR